MDMCLGLVAQVDGATYSDLLGINSLLRCFQLRSSRKTVKPVASGGGKTDLTKVGLNSVENDIVKNNLMGKSRYMGKKDWVDSQGRKGKVCGVWCLGWTVLLPAALLLDRAVDK